MLKAKHAQHADFTFTLISEKIQNPFISISTTVKIITKLIFKKKYKI